MAKIVIHVPFEKELLDALNVMSKRQRKARSGLIPQACVNYLRQIENAELDKIYRLGYKKIPEETDIGEVQVAFADRVLQQ